MQANTTFIRYIILLVTVISLFILGVYFGWNWRYARTTNDAFVHAHIIALAPQEIKGRVTGVYVSDYASVKKGQLLFQIDPQIYEDAYEQSLANYHFTQDQIAYLANRVQDAQYQIKIAQANFQTAQAHYLEKSSLAKQGFVSQFNLRTLYADFIRTQNQVNQAQQQFEEAVHNLGSNIDGKNVRLLRAEAALRIAKRHLDETKIYAPCDGIIVNSMLRVGDYLNTGQSLMSLIDDHSWQIYAYFQETAVGKMHIGDKMRVKLLMYPNLVTYGHIVAIERGSSRSPQEAGSTYLRYIKPEQEWILLPQRFLVYINFDWPYKDKPLEVGATVYVSAQ